MDDKFGSTVHKMMFLEGNNSLRDFRHLKMEPVYNYLNFTGMEHMLSMDTGVVSTRPCFNLQRGKINSLTSNFTSSSCFASSNFRICADVSADLLHGEMQIKNNQVNSSNSLITHNSGGDNISDPQAETVEVDVDICNDSTGQCNEESCNRSTVTLEDLNKTPRKESMKSEKFHCTLCFQTFTQKVNLTKHLRIHTGERPYKCEFCHKSFRQQSNLWKHIRTHTGERPYSCEICHKSFTQAANLTKHRAIHTGERPFTCTVCLKAFSQRANLIKHERIHSGEKPYTCRYCCKRFAQQVNMEKHERIHTGIKPYICKLCSKAFSQHSNLTKHVLVHDKIKPYACSHCEHAYTQKSNLFKHQAKCPKLDFQKCK